LLLIFHILCELSYIIPAVSIPVALRTDCEHSIPWLLAYISLLVNALADFGFVNDVMNKDMEHFGLGSVLHFLVSNHSGHSVLVRQILCYERDSKYEGYKALSSMFIITCTTDITC